MPACNQCQKAGWKCPQYGDSLERMFQYPDVRDLERSIHNEPPRSKKRTSCIISGMHPIILWHECCLYLWLPSLTLLNQFPLHSRLNYHQFFFPKRFQTLSMIVQSISFFPLTYFGTVVLSKDIMNTCSTIATIPTSTILSTQPSLQSLWLHMLTLSNIHIFLKRQLNPLDTHSVLSIQHCHPSKRLPKITLSYRSSCSIHLEYSPVKV